MAGAQGHLLIVDDDNLNRKLLTRALAEQGHTSATAENGQQALAMLRAGAFDVVLLDVLMPEMDGYETLAQIKQDSALRHLPVIMISAVDEMDSVLRCIELGATDYLPKPFNAGLLRARLSASLASKRLRDLELEYLEQVGYVAEAAASVEANVFNSQSLDRVAARTDALGQLARVFQRMAREVHAREQRLKRQLEQLQLDVEERRKAAGETPAVHIPMDQRQALARGQALPERARGAALFADISGFTPLTAALAGELGLQRGAEELTRQINRVYAALIDEVHRYGGSVVSFSGDAITCWFDEQDLTGQRKPVRSALRAAACALAMQAAMQPFSTVSTPAGTRIELAIKVAVVSGPVRRFVIGDPRFRLIDALAGRILDVLAHGEHLAERGEVLVEAAVVKEAGERLVIAGWREADRFAVVAGLADADDYSSPWPELAPEAIPEAQAQPWMLAVVFEKVSGKQSALLSELRPAVALFLKFGGLDYDEDEAAGTKLDAFMRWVQGVIGRRDGAILQLTIGDKGSYLYGTFGAPAAHADDAVRAVSAALELQAPPASLGFVTQIQIGIASGQMRAGAYGSYAQRTYGVLGDRTNLAARLMQSATDGILCDEVVYHAAQSQLEFDALPPVRVKGRPEPVAVYRPRGKRQAGPAALVDRAAQRALLIDRLSPADQLTLKVASVIGPVFGLDLLCDIYPDEAARGDVGAHLETLAELDLIERPAAGADAAYRFTDSLAHETAYHLMLFAQRRQLHRAVAEWYERIHAADLAPHYALLAHHWRAAEDAAKAIQYLELAGEQARQNGALEAAEKYFSESLDLEAQASVLSAEYSSTPDSE